MLLRASYAEETKRGTLVHELAHRLAADVPFKGDHRADLPVRVCDVWVDLWGQEFADGQVRIEGLRKGIVDYDGIWKRTLAIPAEERARRLKEILGRSRAPVMTRPGDIGEEVLEKRRHLTGSMAATMAS